jgi:hypothetical protein
MLKLMPYKQASIEGQLKTDSEKGFLLQYPGSTIVTAPPSQQV